MAANIWRYLIIGLTAAAVCIAAAIPFALWGTGKAPEFYGAFTAAIVAAIAVVVGAFYQSDLTRRRDDALRRQDQIAEAIDLRLWLEHAADELDFIVSILDRTIRQMTSDDKFQVDMSLDQFREVISPKFSDDLLARARAATRLPPGLAGQIARTLYKTFHTADRVLLLRGASEDYRPEKDQLEKYLFVLRRRANG